MKKIKIYGSEIEVDLWHEKQIELYREQMPNTPKTNDLIRFVMLWEPPEIVSQLVPAMADQVGITLKNEHLFDYILTHNQDVLNASKKAKIFEVATCWMQEYDFPEKTFGISTLVGFKRMAEGHNLRQKLWYKQDRIECPKTFFLSREHQGVENFNNSPVLGDSKKPLFNSQFHIAIENVKRENYFSEKLIDALITKTIPIYYGCSNIEKWFNPKGIFVVNGLDDIISVCNSITPDTYSQMLPFIEENYEKSIKFKDIGNRLKNRIEDILQIK